MACLQAVCGLRFELSIKTSKIEGIFYENSGISIEG